MIMFLLGYGIVGARGRPLAQLGPSNKQVAFYTVLCYVYVIYRRSPYDGM